MKFLIFMMVLISANVSLAQSSCNSDEIKAAKSSLAKHGNAVICADQKSAFENTQYINEFLSCLPNLGFRIKDITMMTVPTSGRADKDVCVIVGK